MSRKRRDLEDEISQVLQDIASHSTRIGAETDPEERNKLRKDLDEVYAEADRLKDRLEKLDKKKQLPLLSARERSKIARDIEEWKMKSHNVMGDFLSRSKRARNPWLHATTVSITSMQAIIQSMAEEETALAGRVHDYDQQLQFPATSALSESQAFSSLHGSSSAGHQRRSRLPSGSANPSQHPFQFPVQQEQNRRTVADTYPQYQTQPGQSSYSSFRGAGTWQDTPSTMRRQPANPSEEAYLTRPPVGAADLQRRIAPSTADFERMPPQIGYQEGAAWHSGPQYATQRHLGVGSPREEDFQGGPLAVSSQRSASGGAYSSGQHVQPHFHGGSAAARFPSGSSDGVYPQMPSMQQGQYQGSGPVMKFPSGGSGGVYQGQHYIPGASGSPPAHQGSGTAHPLVPPPQYYQPFPRHRRDSQVGDRQAQGHGQGYYKGT